MGPVAAVVRFLPPNNAHAGRFFLQRVPQRISPLRFSQFVRCSSQGLLLQDLFWHGLVLVGILQVLLQIIAQVGDPSAQQQRNLRQKGRQQDKAHQKVAPQSQQIADKESFWLHVIISKPYRRGTDKGKPVSIVHGEFFLHALVSIGSGLEGDDQHPEQPESAPEQDHGPSGDGGFEAMDEIVHDVGGDASRGGQDASKEENGKETERASEEPSTHGGGDLVAVSYGGHDCEPEPGRRGHVDGTLFLSRRVGVALGQSLQLRGGLVLRCESGLQLFLVLAPAFRVQFGLRRRQGVVHVFRGGEDLGVEGERRGPIDASYERKRHFGIGVERRVGIVVVVGGKETQPILAEFATGFAALGKVGGHFRQVVGSSGGAAVVGHGIVGLFDGLRQLLVGLEEAPVGHYGFKDFLERVRFHALVVEPQAQVGQVVDKDRVQVAGELGLGFLEAHVGVVVVDLVLHFQLAQQQPRHQTDHDDQLDGDDDSETTGLAAGPFLEVLGNAAGELEALLSFGHGPSGCGAGCFHQFGLVRRRGGLFGFGFFHGYVGRIGGRVESHRGFHGRVWWCGAVVCCDRCSVGFFACVVRGLGRCSRFIYKSLPSGCRD